MSALDELVDDALRNGDGDGLESAGVSREGLGTMVQNVSDALGYDESPLGAHFGTGLFGVPMLMLVTNRRVVYGMTSPGVVHSFDWDEIADCKHLWTALNVYGKDGREMTLTVWNPAEAGKAHEYITRRITSENE